MDFGSEYVYTYEEPDFEFISEDEYDDGMRVSDSDSDEDTCGNINVVPPPGSGSNLFSKSLDISSPSVPPPPPRAEPPPLPPVSSVYSAPPPPPVRRPTKGREPKKPKRHWKSAGDVYSENSHSHIKGQKVRKGDTNIVSVKLDQLTSPTSMHAGDPVTCAGCSAILSKLSKVAEEQDDKVWECEFCSARNVVDVDDEEIPKEEDITFMLEPALSTTASGPAGLDESLVIFCVDVSGSMCVTTEVPGNIQLRGAESLRRARQFNRERGDQYLPRQQRNVTYISRLQSVQAAIDHQLQEMEKSFPNRRVALITFSNEVTVIGDGKSDPVAIAGDKLGNRDTLKTIVSELPFPEAIKTTRQQMGKKLFDLEESGPTALGPALLVSITMAAKVRGSKVILCTDGMANIGMGKLDNFKNDQEAEEATTFYEDMSTEAVDNGVSVSVITIKGTDCKLVEIGKMADKTGGQVNIVDPLKLTQEFSTILANQIVATNVVATFILHKDLFFFNEESEESKVVKNIGNATADTVITFEYGVRTAKKIEEGQQAEKTKEETSEGKSEASEMKEEPKAGGSGEEPKAGGSGEEPKASGSSDKSEGATSGNAEQKEQPKDIPFQLQIVYTDTEGAKAMRLITRTKPVTSDRRKAERMANLNILATHTAQTTAALAQDGCYTVARSRAMMNQRVAWRHTREASEDGDFAPKRAAYKNMFSKISKMDQYLNTRQKAERATIGHTYSDEEDESDELYENSAESRSAKPPRRKMFLSALRKKRSEATDDDGAALVFKGKTAKKFFE